MTKVRKISALVPARALASTQAYTGQSATETVRLALERLAHEAWSRRLLDLRGKSHLDIDLSESREDREFDEHGNVIR